MLDDDIFNGSVRPDIIPINWKGRPIKQGKNGWCWYNPDNDLDAVFLYKDSSSVVVRAG